MKVTMAELNKGANKIINQVASSGETVTVYKHGRPVAEIKPLVDVFKTRQAMEYLSQVQPIQVTASIGSALEAGRKRGV